MATTEKENLTETEAEYLTPFNSEEFSLQITFNGLVNEKIIQEIFEIALKHNVRPYSDFFTHKSEEVLKNFQNEISSKNFNCSFIFRSPKPLA